MICTHPIRTLAVWRLDLTAYRDVEEAYRVALNSLARRVAEGHSKHEEIRNPKR